MSASINKLNILDFSPGIRAKDINENFDLIKKWIDSERLRSGGWGVVEGFELTKDLPDFDVLVSDGIIINEDGEEVKAAGTRLHAGAPSWRNITEEVTVEEGGIITLQFNPYSDTYKRTIYYNPPVDNYYDENELVIINTENEKYFTLKDIRAISENIITVNSEYVGKKVRVNYIYANDRIDGILIKRDGSEFIYELGIISTSPSQQVIQDYLEAGYYLIGFAYWHIGAVVDVEFITKDRSLRPIYVDKNGNIFLNGVLYTGYNFIYFKEPEYPTENDLWYNTEEEILYIWRPDKNNKYSWTPVNDLSRFYREFGRFELSENPDDLQTFNFADKPNLRFVPGKNQLTIVIDQVVVMKDQYTELYNAAKYDKDACTGYGFKLNEPLERPSVVEVFVDHSVNTKGEHLELFPHIASFIDIDTPEIDGDIATAKSQYEIGHSQLEVWINGIYQENHEDFAELTSDLVEASLDDTGKLSNSFKLLRQINDSDKVTYKITRQMATYDNFRKITDNLNEKVATAVEALDETRDSLDTIIKETSTALDDLKTRVTANENNIKSLDENKISSVTLKTLDASVKSKLVRGQTSFIVNALSTEITIPNLSVDDFISCYYVDDMQRYILIKDEDYIVSDNNSQGVIIELDTKWLGSGTAKLYIEAILIGAE